MSEYIVTCDEETASWVGNDVDSMRKIVRCCDCKHYNGWACEQSECLCCGELTHRVEPDGFCKWGERA